MLGNNWYPSEIENIIYEAMEDYEMGIELYEEGLVDMITDYFINYFPSTEWKLVCSPWPDMSGGVCSVSWMENGHIHMIMFDYIKGDNY